MFNQVQIGWWYDTHYNQTIEFSEAKFCNVQSGITNSNKRLLNAA